jgi:hypothetical protein
MAHQNMRRYIEETILQRDNPVRKFPTGASVLKLATYRERADPHIKKRHARAASSTGYAGETPLRGECHGTGE